MIVGTVRERKVGKHRVGLTPEGADSLVRAGHRVLVEVGAGLGSGFDDEAYGNAGAEIVDDVNDVWRRAELLVKVKEPVEEEFGRLRSDLVLFTYLHLAALPEAQQVRSMGDGAVVVDVDIDQGGCVETARPTTHDDPVYVEEGVVHYGVANMPGSVPHTSTGALTAATLPYALRLAAGGLDALKADPALAAGANVVRGRITNPGVAEAVGERMAPLDEVGEREEVK